MLCWWTILWQTYRYLYLSQQLPKTLAISVHNITSWGQPSILKKSMLTENKLSTGLEGKDHLFHLNEHFIAQHSLSFSWLIMEMKPSGRVQASKS
jgi:hypothetical protein